MIDLGAWATESYRIPVAEDNDDARRRRRRQPDAAATSALTCQRPGAANRRNAVRAALPRRIADRSRAKPAERIDRQRVIRDELR